MKYRTNIFAALLFVIIQSNLVAQNNIHKLNYTLSDTSKAIEFYNDGLNYAGENIVSKILNMRGLGDVYANLSNYSK